MADSEIVCQKCGYKFGEMVQVGDCSWANIGGVLTNYHHGVCAVCGQEFYWSISGQQLSRLVKRTLEQRKKYLN
jgi:hypothetical protein